MTKHVFAGMTKHVFAGMTKHAFAGMTKHAFAGMTKGGVGLQKLLDCHTSFAMTNWYLIKIYIYAILTVDVLLEKLL